MIWQRREIQRRTEKAYTWLLSKLYKEIKKPTKNMFQDIREDEISTKNVPSANHSSPPCSLWLILMTSTWREVQEPAWVWLSRWISFKSANYFIFNEGRELAISRRTIKEKKISSELSLPFNTNDTTGTDQKVHEVPCSVW